MDQLSIETVAGAPEGVRVVRLKGPFTLTSIWDFQAQLRSGDDRATVLDLTDVPYMDSAALGSVMALHVSCQRLEHKCALVGVAERIRTLFKVSGVDKILTTYATVEEALRVISTKGP